MKNFYTVITSSHSVNSSGGVGRISLMIKDEDQIISIASEQTNNRGESLTDIAGIEMIGVNPDEYGDCEDFEMARPWNDGEELEIALTELRHDGHIFEVFKFNEENEAFIERASFFGLRGQAEKLVN